MEMSAPESGSAVTDAAQFNVATWTVIVGAGSSCGVDILLGSGSCMDYVSGRLVGSAGWCIMGRVCCLRRLRQTRAKCPSLLQLATTGEAECWAALLSNALVVCRSASGASVAYLMGAAVVLREVFGEVGWQVGHRGCL